MAQVISSVPSATTPRAQKVVLCIDDNEGGLAIRKIFLETFNYSVLTASSACSGLEILASQPVDLAILAFYHQGAGRNGSRPVDHAPHRGRTWRLHPGA